MKVHPDKQKAISLRDMAKITLERLKKTGTLAYPANTLTDYYGIFKKKKIKFKQDLERFKYRIN